MYILLIFIELIYLITSFIFFLYSDSVLRREACLEARVRGILV